jgi:flavin reductase (DIM6/NTAB) family NADH-FMN oxidoreductase RutF
MIEFDPRAHSPLKSQSMMSQLVVPRPIAMISTANEHGVANVAPYSYFMAITGKPMLIAVSMGMVRDRDGEEKHTFANAHRSGDFVVNVTTQRFRDHIEEVGKEYPAGVNEADVVGWNMMPSVKVSSPKVAEAPAHLECEIRQVIDLGEPDVAYSGVHLVIAEVVWVTMDESVCSPDLRIDPIALAPVGRMGYPYFVQAVPEGVYEVERVAWTES